MAKWQTTKDYAQAISHYQNPSQAVEVILWASIQQYGIDNVMEGIKLAEQHDRGIEYVERYLQWHKQENRIVEERLASG